MEWEKVFASKLSHQAEIVKTVLEDHELHAVVINKTDSAYAGLFDGKYEVRVHPEHTAQAKKIIADEIQF